MKLSGNKILITGGASGIGLGLTERFLKEKNTVIVCGRRKDLLKELSAKYPAVITRTADLSDESEREALFEWLHAEHPDLNVLVNNAGIQNWMQLSDDDFYERAKEEIAINVLAPLHLSALFIKVKAAECIINVTSGLSFVPLTKVPVYCGTKAFLHSFTLSARYILKPRNIEVIEMIPPALNTDLGGKGLHDGQPAVADFVDAVFKQLEAGKNELSFGFSEMMTQAGPDALKAAFSRMNPG